MLASNGGWKTLLFMNGRKTAWKINTIITETKLNNYATEWLGWSCCMLLVPVIIPFVKQDWESASRNLREWDEKDFLLRSSSLTSMTEMPNPAGFYSFVMPRPPGTNCEARRSVSISTAIHLSKMLLRFLIKSPLAHARLYYCSAVYYFVFIVWSRFF